MTTRVCTSSDGGLVHGQTHAGWEPQPLGDLVASRWRGHHTDIMCASAIHIHANRPGIQTDRESEWGGIWSEGVGMEGSEGELE